MPARTGEAHRPAGARTVGAAEGTSSRRACSARATAATKRAPLGGQRAVGAVLCAPVQDETRRRWPRSPRPTARTMSGQKSAADEVRVLHDPSNQTRSVIPGRSEPTIARGHGEKYEPISRAPEHCDASGLPGLEPVQRQHEEASHGGFAVGGR